MTAREGLLEGKNVLVAGASRGLGRAIAIACAREGADVGITYRERVEGAEDTAMFVEQRHGRRAEVAAMDGCDPASVDEAVADLSLRLGRVDAWVTCFGHRLASPIASTDVDALKKEIDVNLLGPILCARAVLGVMVRQKRGVLLHVSSVAVVKPPPGAAAYAAAKGGVEALTRALAVEHARYGIRVLCLRAGPLEGDLPGGAARKPAAPNDVAELAAFLLSDRASHATGSVVTVDGGFTLT